jgi:transcriptional activator of cad operon
MLGERRSSNQKTDGNHRSCMEHPPTSVLRIGAWRVSPASGHISQNGVTSRVEVRTMRLLLCLAEHAGEVVSIDDLLNQVWPEVTVAPDSVYQAVTSLRRLLGDDPKQPAYIETVPRLGYRMIAAVSPWADQSDAPTGAHANAPAGAHAIAQTHSSPSSAGEPPTFATNGAPATPKKSDHRLSTRIALALGAAICVALIFAFLFRGKLVNFNDLGSPAIAPQPQKSIAVLPFLDLTDAMNQEPFADGMTEELIDKLSKVPGLRVPSPTASFYFKGQLWPRSNGAPQTTVADIARILSVAYVLDGSVRKSSSRLRVDARMIRADNGYVVWSETYDRPFDDILMVQDDIAGKVTKALTASIEAAPNH